MSDLLPVSRSSSFDARFKLGTARNTEQSVGQDSSGRTVSWLDHTIFCFDHITHKMSSVFAPAFSVVGGLTGAVVVTVGAVVFASGAVVSTALGYVAPCLGNKEDYRLIKKIFGFIPLKHVVFNLPHTLQP